MTSGFIHVECFNTHIGLSVLETWPGSIMAVRRSPKPLVGVRFPPWSPSIRGIGIIGNTVALQASVSGSIPLSSTTVGISRSMENTFCLDLDLPVSIDLSEINRLKSLDIDATKWQMHDLAVDENLDKFLERYRLKIIHTEAHYVPPNTITFAHIDGSIDSKVKLNYIFGAKGSTMQWFKLKDPDMVPSFNKTTLDTPYFRFEADQIDLIYSAEVKQPSMVEVGVIHNVVNPTDEPRWCLCYMLGDPHLNKFVDWQDAYKRLRKFVVRENTTI